MLNTQKQNLNSTQQAHVLIWIMFWYFDILLIFDLLSSLRTGTLKKVTKIAINEKLQDKDLGEFMCEEPGQRIQRQS